MDTPAVVHNPEKLPEQPPGHVIVLDGFNSKLFQGETLPTGVLGSREKNIYRTIPTEGDTADSIKDYPVHHYRVTLTEFALTAAERALSELSAAHIYTESGCIYPREERAILARAEFIRGHIDENNVGVGRAGSYVLAHRRAVADLHQSRARSARQATTIRRSLSSARRNFERSPLNPCLNSNSPEEKAFRNM